MDFPSFRFEFASCRFGFYFHPLGKCFPAPASGAMVRRCGGADPMSKFRASLERATRLRPRRGALDNHVSQIRIGGANASQIVLLPYSQGLGYFIVPTGGPTPSVQGDDFEAERVSLPLTLWARLRLWLLFKKKKYLQFDEFSLFCYGVKPERKRFTTFNQHMFNTGVALDGRSGHEPPRTPPGLGADRAGGASGEARFDPRRRHRRPCLLRGHMARYRRRSEAAEHPLRPDRHHRARTRSAARRSRPRLSARGGHRDRKSRS